jgi:dienelactone hydrolase
MEAAAPWVRGGAAVASIDFPLHGERASAKLSQRLIRSVDFDAEQGGPDSLDARLLLLEFTRQSVVDLRRAMDALGGLPEIDETRLAYAGFSLGGILGALCCAADPRPRAAALALAGGGFGPEEVDPCTHIGKLAPRPLLLVGARRDQRVPRRATEALFDAAGEPKRLEWFDGDHSHLPGAALKAIWVFLRDQLGV